MPDPQGRRAVLSDVQVEQDLDGAVVTLEGVGELLYALAEEEDVRRLALDLPGVRTAGVPESIALVDGIVEEVVVSSTFDAVLWPTTRVEFFLLADFDYDLVQAGDSLQVLLTTRDPMAGEALGGAEAAMLGFEEPIEGPAGASTEAWEELSPGATALLSVEPAGGGEGTYVRLVTDGRVDEVESFAIVDPDRLVIDLPTLENRATTSQMPVESAHVKMVRIGSHPDKVRVVLDGADREAPFAYYRIVHIDDGLVVELGPRAADEEMGEPAEVPVADEEADAELVEADEETGAELAETDEEADAELADAGDEDEAPESAWTAPLEDFGFAEPVDPTPIAPMAEQTPAAMAVEEAAPSDAPEDGSSLVTSIDFESRLDRMVVRIEVQGSVSYQLFEPNTETVVVSLPNATLAPGAEARITPEPGGPISLVMAFQQPETARPEVRVVVKRGPGLRPRVGREGSSLVLDFERGAVVAVTPPALAPDAPAPPPQAAQPVTPAPAPSTAAAKALAAATAPAPPAAPTDTGGIAVLREGGLLDGKEYLGRRISLDFKDVDVDDVLRLIAEVSDLNIIAADNVKGKVTIRLVDVPWDQALDVILLAKGLGFVKVGNVLRIAPKGVLQAETEARLHERRAMEKLEDLIVKFQPVNYARVGSVKEMVRRLLTPRGTVNVDSRTNTVILKDIPSVIDEAVALIKAIDTPTPQVLIEAKIVEANLDFTRELGTVWGVGVQRFNDGFNSGSGDDESVGSEDFRFRADPTLLSGVSELNNFVVSNPITALPTALFSLGAFLLDEQFNLELQLQASEAAGEGKVISSPRIVTLDNREAIIEQGVSIPFQTFENGDAALEFVDAVLQLKVRPHITSDRSIIMKIEISRNAPDDSVAVPGGAPAIAKNQAKTETMVYDGQTLVIGGIYTIQKSNRMSRVPYLHRIPLIGAIFRNKLVRDVRKELLIFVTPRIVELPQLGT